MESSPTMKLNFLSATQAFLPYDDFYMLYFAFIPQHRVPVDSVGRSGLGLYCRRRPAGMPPGGGVSNQTVALMLLLICSR